MKKALSLIPVALLGAVLFTGCDSAPAKSNVETYEAITAYKIMDSDDSYYIKLAEEGIELMTDSYEHIADIYFEEAHNDTVDVDTANGDTVYLGSVADKIEEAKDFAQKITKENGIIKKIDITSDYEQDGEKGYLMEIYLNNDIDFDINQATSIWLAEGYSLNSGGSVNELDGKIVEQKSVFFIPADSVEDITSALQPFLFGVNGESYYVSVK